MNHNIDKYISDKIFELKWQDKQLSEISGLSKGQVSKLKNGSVTKLSAQTFYLVVKAFNDSINNATKIVFLNQKFDLNKWIPKERNEFGKIMSKYENITNSLEEISAKTGINEIRLSELYYRNGALDAYELIIIEKAIGKKPGELFEEFYGNKCESHL